MNREKFRRYNLGGGVGVNGARTLSNQEKAGNFFKKAGATLAPVAGQALGNLFMPGIGGNIGKNLGTAVGGAIGKTVHEDPAKAVAGLPTGAQPNALGGAPQGQGGTNPGWFGGSIGSMPGRASEAVGGFLGKMMPQPIANGIGSAVGSTGTNFLNRYVPESMQNETVPGLFETRANNYVNSFGYNPQYLGASYGSQEPTHLESFDENDYYNASMPSLSAASGGHILYDDYQYEDLPGFQVGGLTRAYNSAKHGLTEARDELWKSGRGFFEDRASDFGGMLGNHIQRKLGGKHQSAYGGLIGGSLEDMTLGDLADRGGVNAIPGLRQNLNSFSQYAPRFMTSRLDRGLRSLENLTDLTPEQRNQSIGRFIGSTIGRNEMSDNLNKLERRMGDWWNNREARYGAARGTPGPMRAGVADLINPESWTDLMTGRPMDISPPPSLLNRAGNAAYSGAQALGTGAMALGRGIGYAGNAAYNGLSRLGNGAYNWMGYGQPASSTPTPPPAPLTPNGGQGLTPQRALTATELMQARQNLRSPMNSPHGEPTDAHQPSPQNPGGFYNTAANVGTGLYNAATNPYGTALNVGTGLYNAVTDPSQTLNQAYDMGRGLVNGATNFLSAYNPIGGEAGTPSRWNPWSWGNISTL